ncbi:hypothetical protein [Streptomyces formicae]|uniref:Uncharacterized protein n=1 Tax=Streptomyces formicae TaxID=1616117 RepID=A0A291QDZ8_9ACTN|nr:hypothetical protein [Streptomyces formicae]ATL29929.1 hypothetical protein KY5_4911c [Streptomyces formicae]
MTHGNRLARLTTGALAASALLATGLAIAPTAAAAPATAPTAIQGTAPSCVKRDVIKHKKYVKVTNLCGEAMHLKVVIDWGNDSPCLTYQHGEQWEWNWGRGSYGKVVTC